VAEEASRLLGQVEDEPGRADDRSRREEDRVELEWSVVEESEGCLVLVDGVAFVNVCGVVTVLSSPGTEDCLLSSAVEHAPRIG
jgi:hypothetical protein